jgi:DNA repair exonuclease SbcCD ATPase subunit
VLEEDHNPAENTYVPAPHSSPLKPILAVLVILYICGSAYFLVQMHSQLTRLAAAQEKTNLELADHNKRLNSADASMETLADQLGMTKKELAERAAELQRQQRASEARLQKEHQKEITAVSGEVAGVKTEVGGVKTDVASTKTDLEATKAKLERAIGDLGIQSGLIAKTRDDLEVLKHKGDRNYTEFTLTKNKQPTPVSTISLQLKKTDPKRSKFTMNVVADDRTIEKKDRTANEPIQFYSGREHQLFEIVVWTVDKNKVTGYLSTPHGAPQPVNLQQ